MADAEVEAIEEMASASAAEALYIKYVSCCEKEFIEWLGYLRRAGAGTGAGGNRRGRGRGLGG